MVNYEKEEVQNRASS